MGSKFKDFIAFQTNIANNITLL